MYLSYFERYLSSTEQESLERFTLCDALITCTRLIQRTPAGLFNGCLLTDYGKKKKKTKTRLVHDARAARLFVFKTSS